MVTIIFSFILLFVAATLMAQYTFRYIYSYKIGDHGIKIVLLHILPIMNLVRFEDIAEIRKVAFKETMPFKSIGMFFALRFGNRVWGEIVLIRKKEGFNKIILITPDKADNFIEDVLKHLVKV